MEIKTIKTELINKVKVGSVSVAYVKFEKVRVYKRGNEVISEVPFIEFAGVVSVKRFKKVSGRWEEIKDKEQHIWLTPNQLVKLQEAMSDFDIMTSKKEPAQAPSSQAKPSTTVASETKLKDSSQLQSLCKKIGVIVSVDKQPSSVNSNLTNLSLKNIPNYEDIFKKGKGEVRC